MPVTKITILSVLVCCALSLNTMARQGAAPVSRSRATQPMAALKQLVLPATDAALEIAADARAGNVPLRFATPVEVMVTPGNHGTWENVAAGRLWRLRVQSAGATDLNFGFTDFWLPPGATLHIISESENYFQGPYQARDNKPHRQLWTPVIPGDRAVIELFVPDGTAIQPQLMLTRVNCGYRDMFHGGKVVAAAKSGSCNIDVACPDAAPWADEIRSVARYSIGGTTLCTGTLMNNTTANKRPFFLTANHCGLSTRNASTVVVYWNFQSPSCGQQGGGSLSQNQSGAVFRMAKSDVDVALIELEDMPDSAFDVFYSGWDRTTNAMVSAGVVGIHHPNADEKSISFSDHTVTQTTSCLRSSPSITHYEVVWSRGVTEPGSSGSGIWDMNSHRLIGTLSGGGSSCSNLYVPDCYGRFSVAWAGGTSAATRLRDWLDASHARSLQLAGYDPSLAAHAVAAGWSLMSEGCVPGNGAVDPRETVEVVFAVRNTGGMNLTNVVGSLRATGGILAPSAPVDFGTLIAGGAEVARSFRFVASGRCGATMSAKLDLHSGGVVVGTASYSLPLGVHRLVENFDSVEAPSLPASWSGSNFGGSPWITTHSDLGQAAFASEPDTVSDELLTSPSFTVPSAGARLSFVHKYDLEPSFDGGVLEISIENADFIDIIAAGGRFLRGGYRGLISSRYGSALAGRRAWTGTARKFKSTVVRFPAGAAGKSVRLRWRLATDEGNGGLGWSIRSIDVTPAICCTGHRG